MPKMPKPNNEQVTFMLGADGQGRPMLIFGMTDAAWEYMKDGLTHNFDFTSIGLPMTAMILRGKDSEAVMAELQAAADTLGIPIQDDRDKDFSVKDKRH